jgi:hypothetical protein
MAGWIEIEKIIVCLIMDIYCIAIMYKYRSADKSLAQPGRKQATVTEDFEFHTHISCL